ncbi:MAG: restriction endonuclease subunit S [Paucibacter sp.]|nr:restriction endonuclease subunit S [Roseateles sp.]
MSDVTESGEWKGHQERALGDVRNGFTAFLDDDVLVAKITPCFENGKGAHVTGLVNGIGFGSTEFHVLRAKNGASARFVHHLVQSGKLRRSAEAQMSGSAGQRRVPREFFETYEVPNLGPVEQVNIAQVLDTLDTTIRQTEAIIEKLKQVKQGLLHDLLTRGIDANGELRPMQSQAPHLYKESSSGWIPNTWAAASLGGLIDGSPRNGIYKPAGDIGSGSLLVGQTAFTADGTVDPVLARRCRVSIAEAEVFGLHPDDILVSRVFATREGVGKPVIVPDLGEAAVYESNMMRMRVGKNTIAPRLLFHWLKQREARKWIMSRAFASNQASINRSTICGVPVPLPPEDEQERILAVVDTQEQRLRKEELNLAKALKLKSGLMDDLLTGRVRVTALLNPGVFA